jgi:hypothetical protein
MKYFVTVLPSRPSGEDFDREVVVTNHSNDFDDEASALFAAMVAMGERYVKVADTSYDTTLLALRENWEVIDSADRLEIIAADKNWVDAVTNALVGFAGHDVDPTSTEAIVLLEGILHFNGPAADVVLKHVAAGSPWTVRAPVEADGQQ